MDVVKSRLIVAGVVAFLAIVSVAAAASSRAVMVRVTSGQWNGQAWTLEASDAVSGGNVGYCYRMAFARAADSSRACSRSAFVMREVPGRSAYGMNFAQHLVGACPALDYVVGPVVATASEVDVTLSTGRVVKTVAIAPPPGLARGVRFFVTRVPCGTWAASAVGRNETGKIVASFS
jgi:hypothetical protein